MSQAPSIPPAIGGDYPTHTPPHPSGGPRIVSAREAGLPPIRPIPPVKPLPHYRSESSESSDEGDRGSEITLTEEEKALANDPVRRSRCVLNTSCVVQVRLLKGDRRRMAFMPYAAEFLGTTFFVMFGCGANAQVGLTSDPNVRALGPAGVRLSRCLSISTTQPIPP